MAEAFAALSEAPTDIELDLIGCGPLESVVRLRLSRCASRVRFLGFRQWHELPEQYCNAEARRGPLAVSTAGAWSFPEGLAAGLPVITGIERARLGSDSARRQWLADSCQ